MTKYEIMEVFAYVESLWPGAIKSAHHEAMYPALERMPLSVAQAKAAIGAFACEHKGYVTPAHVIERLKSIAYANTPDDARSRRAKAMQERNMAEAEHLAVVARDNAETDAWIAGLSDDDFADLMLWVQHRNPAAFLSVGSKSLASFRESRGGRGLIHAAWRASRGGAA